ncbi:DEAD/DEAH box helicase [Microcoleus sp.]|uniref:DEAD/DEAH box helicase n=1 Tax=Microcoleus sp. TaxID=44472 RepID=UPI00403E7292
MSSEHLHSPFNLRNAIPFDTTFNQLPSTEREAITFRGLFIGIDRYASPKISWLSCAQRDATALHALFCDTLGGEATLLVDQEGTCVAIQEQLANLATCNENDIVVVAFSGHGTNSHQLVAHDTDTYNLDNTSISLERLTELITRIPARRLICFLDCCFSGGVEAKVFQVETVARNLDSIDAALAQLSGQGRIILTASGPTEPAYENMQLGHGLLTYYLLEALQGVEEVQQSGKLAVYPLLQYITQRVIDASTQINKLQNPTLRGQIDGELLLPIFKPGTLYRAAFPERSHPEVTADIQSLAEYGFPEALLQNWANVIPSFNALQLAAINEFKVLEGEHLVVSAPTSSGKTTVGELAALKSVLERKRALFLLPLKALVSDKLKTFNQSYGSFGIFTIQATGETDDITPLLRGQYDICLLTYEKFAAVVLANPHILNQVGTVVIDEVQMIADETRGANLEFILTLLRMRQRQGIEPQVIALSAVIGTTNGLEHWLGARLLRREERPVPLDEGILLADGRFRFIDGDSSEEKLTEPLFQRQFIKGSSQDYVIPLVRKLVNEGKQVIVFRDTKGEARGCALYLARELGLPPAQAALDALPTGDDSKASTELKLALKAGVAFHTSELAPEERRVVEEQFRANNTTLRAIAATTTLAMGINTPASAVVIVGLNHPLPNGGSKPYSVAEYKNLAGRAGRLQLAERGTSYLLASDPHKAHILWTYYIKGYPESLVSRFVSPDTDPRSLIVRTLAATEQLFKQKVAQQLPKQGMHAEDLIEFLEASFGAFQQMQSTQQWKWNHAQLLETLKSLLQYRLVERDEKNFYHLTPLGRLAGEAGVEVESIIRLVACFTSLNPESIHEPTLLTATQLTVELSSIDFPLNRKSTKQEPTVWKQELLRQGVPNSLMSNLDYRTIKHQGTLRAKKAVACLLFVTYQSMAEIETILTKFGGAFGGAGGAIRDVANRTCDLLPTVAQVAEILHPSLDLEERVSRLLIRLNVGVPPAAVDLAKQVGNRLTRGEYLQLLKAELCSIDAIEVASDSDLLPNLNHDQEKLVLVRKAVKSHRQQELESIPSSSILEPFES